MNIIQIKYMKYVGIFFVILQSSLYAEEFIDLEQNPQDFILETKQIIVPGFPGAFNASIIRWRNSLLMCFRVRECFRVCNNNLISTFEFGLVWLDDDFNPISTPRILEIRGDPSSYSQNQDARLIVINQRLYIIYSNFIKIDEIITRRMFVAELHYKEAKFFIMNPVCLHPFEGWSKRWEKNWTPFNYNENLLLAYSLIPHRILRPSLEIGECTTESSTDSLIDWQWGELRGGTPAVLDGDEYLAFFHSSKIMATSHSHGKKIQHYFMGAYTFSSQPPFEITRISPEPIVGKNFYNGQAYPTWKPVHVVFPMSCISDGNYLWLTYGRQDFEIWVAKIDKQGLYRSLIQCSKIADKESESVCPMVQSPIESMSENQYGNS